MKSLKFKLKGKDVNIIMRKLKDRISLEIEKEVGGTWVRNICTIFQLTENGEQVISLLDEETCDSFGLKQTDCFTEHSR
jgi:hypothetical protein